MGLYPVKTSATRSARAALDKTIILSLGLCIRLHSRHYRELP
ncbi:hypothetical protein Y88_2152 [Novosphingobium nitrogenifigens DSM 19370]|uniref:Uncharacterized protein n=1 Tax=Novosphingobium nitrogenifigens DSM 19370 TaxID=983920 RepID=F1Z599_9SPHN|nr:hypothetical protein Y88_2152 [Novosphingobium nitrogenifigens DSM 19370]